jgi:hypothetical protein
VIYRFIHAADIHLDSPLRSLALRDPGLSDLIGNGCAWLVERRPQHFLYFSPLPHWHGWLRPVFVMGSKLQLPPNSLVRSIDGAHGTIISRISAPSLSLHLLPLGSGNASGYPFSGSFRTIR